MHKKSLITSILIRLSKKLTKTEILQISLLTLIISTVILSPVMAEEPDTTNVLSLEEVLQMAAQSNSTVLQSIEEIKSAKGSNTSALAAFLPSLSISANYSKTNDPLYSFGFKLQQEIVQSTDFNPDLLNNPDDINQFSTQILYEQPLINVDAWMGKRAAHYGVKATELKGEYTKENIMFAVKQTYFALQLANGKAEVIEKAHQAAQEYLKIAENNLDQGYLKDADVLSVKVRVLELEAQQQDASNQVKAISETLNFLIGRDIDTPVQIADKIEKTAYTKQGFTSVSDRADVLAMYNGTQAQQMMKKSATMKFIPRLNGFGMYNMYDENIGGFNANSYMVGLSLQWKLFNGGQNLGQSKKSKAEYHMAELKYQEYLDKGNMELKQAIRNITVKESQLNSYETAAEQSKESLRIRTDRFKEGLEKTTDLLTSETKYAESELKHLNAIYEYNMAIFRYQLLSSSAK